mmetsp:Transcript_23095/g.36781  ORF Transcript_23095/g.36781 Transcript_23095/m.36781 type:complete len:414 (+) Transcript_23095:441-1682(+)|eukprot:CAMPEP_0203760828 /NCGR_PEP_ID=MMETSP0098-20131031/14037_1 /ASSEMBLY_ACC=CAM_ASM_000208 /TAXON_ID=96639 /ORGANISM=" , Strain NY0313808BC1" /LENGTH=413 /DNA_ID=CAMNT_0050654555 /DNA_START=404 /DNA_END=1645 /DNA_ORIENTATION=+
MRGVSRRWRLGRNDSLTRLTPRLRGRAWFEPNARNVHTQQLPTFKVERFWGWDACEKSLSSSECEPFTMQQLLSLASEEELEHWNGLNLGYSNQSGAPLLRDLVAKRYVSDVSSSDITICAPQEGIYITLLALLEAQDTCVVTTPCYQSLKSIPASIGCNVVEWKARRNTADSCWEFIVDELEDLIAVQPDIKLVVANFPNNPTGALPTAAEMDRITSLCRKHNIWLFVDEMYRGLEHDASDRLAAACESYEKGISLGGLSKTFGLPGLRIGWIATRHHELTSRIRELKDYTTICASSPSEALAIIALGHSTTLESRCKDIVLSGVDTVRAFVEDAHPEVLSWLRPKGGTFSLVELQAHSLLPASTYCDKIIREHKLMLLPGSLFDLPDSSVRICYGHQDIQQRLEQWSTLLP